MNLLILDCETTGIDPEKDKVVELAGVMVDPQKRRVVESWSSLVDPGMPIPPEAMGIHHILNRMVAGKPSLSEVLSQKIMGAIQPVAHNSEFDSKFIPIVGDWICTWRCANHIWPDSPSYGNQTLRYWLKLFKEPEARGFPAHRAGADAWVTAHVLLRMLEERTVAELVALTKAPILLRKVYFGKHVGQLWSEVPRDYLRWILSKSDFDRDVMHTARHYHG
jgi:exodeoxyribonuclease X